MQDLQEIKKENEEYIFCLLDTWSSKVVSFFWTWEIKMLSFIISWCVLCICSVEDMFSAKRNDVYSGQIHLQSSVN